jgi:hypothetical protein
MAITRKQLHPVGSPVGYFTKLASVKGEAVSKLVKIEETDIKECCECKEEKDAYLEVVWEINNGSVTKYICGCCYRHRIEEAVLGGLF